ncbi:MAG: hypothetical protein ACJATT_004095 [Myxococcota bacterium]|jgi:hypothetical protein
MPVSGSPGSGLRRLEEAPAGPIRVTFKRPWADGTDVHAAGVHRATRGSGPAAACSSGALPLRARCPICGRRMTLRAFPWPRAMLRILDAAAAQTPPDRLFVSVRAAAPPLWVRSGATRGGSVPCSEGHGAPQRCPRLAESARDLLTASATQADRSRYGAKGVGITYPSSSLANCPVLSWLPRTRFTNGSKFEGPNRAVVPPNRNAVGVVRRGLIGQVGTHLSGGP